MADLESELCHKCIRSNRGIIPARVVCSLCAQPDGPSADDALSRAVPFEGVDGHILSTLNQGLRLAILPPASQVGK